MRRQQTSTVFIGIGANLANPLKQCAMAIRKMAEIPETKLVATSSFYKSEPLLLPHSNENQVPWYVNVVCRCSTTLSPIKLLESLAFIEKKMGRKRRKKWEPRIIDLDLLFYDDLVMKTKQIEIPHPEIQNRRFVLEPLAEIAKEWEHPLLKKTVGKLASGINQSSKIETIRAALIYLKT